MASRPVSRAVHTCDPGARERPGGELGVHEVLQEERPQLLVGGGRGRGQRQQREQREQRHLPVPVCGCGQGKSSALRADWSADSKLSGFASAALMT